MLCVLIDLFLFRSARDHTAAAEPGREGERDRCVLLPRHRRPPPHHHLEEERKEAKEHRLQVRERSAHRRRIYRRESEGRRCFLGTEFI